MSKELVARAQLFGAIEGGINFWAREVLEKGAEKVVELCKEGDYPHYMTWETNGTQELTSEFANYFSDYPGEVFFSVSPKLWRTSGEKPEDAIKPEIVKTYTEISSWGQLKFVVNGTEESWNELEETVAKFREAGVTYPVWVMGVGATLEAQKGTEAGYIGEAKIATEAFKRGYNYSSRVHVHIWGNTMGT